MYVTYLLYTILLDAYCVLHSQVNEDAMKYEHLQNEVIAFKMKLKKEEMLRKKAEEERREMVKVQSGKFEDSENNHCVH